MTTDITYQLYGYIEYVTSPVGFVTPVFNNAGEYYIQVRSFNNRRIEWELVPEEYKNSIKKSLSAVNQYNFETVIYGFKWNDKVLFANGKNIAEYFNNSFLPSSPPEADLVKEFLSDWPEMELNTTSISKQEIWQQCLDYIGRESIVMPAIFLESLEPTEFNDNILTLKSDKDFVKKVFENQFKDNLLNYIGNEIPNFQIKIIGESPIEEKKPVVSPLPFVYLGGEGPLITEGSFIIQTSINDYQDFDNYIVSDFNSKAYHQALQFIENKTSSIITIHGMAGTGKTHMINSIARKLISSDFNKKVGVYTVFTQSDNRNKISESEIEQFELSASEMDVIFIDNADNIITEKTAIEHLIPILKRWKEIGKKIVLSFRDPLKTKMVETVEENIERLFLNDPGEKDKLKILELKSTSHNMKLSGLDITLLSVDNQIKTFADIQKSIIRKYLTSSLNLKNTNIFISHKLPNLTLSLIESSILNNPSFITNYPLYIPSKPADLYAKMLSQFITDIFKVPHHSTTVGSEMSYVNHGVLFQMNTLQYYFLKNEPFRNFISEVLKESILKDDTDK